MRKLIDKLSEKHRLSREEWSLLIESQGEREYLFRRARELSRQYYGNKVFTRGLIEFTNYCKNNCYYCGIRRDNKEAVRYRLTLEEIMDCCSQGYELGFRTFVLQGGEDGFYTDDKIVEIIQEIKDRYPDCALTLSMGERENDSYLRFYKTGAEDRKSVV